MDCRLVVRWRLETEICPGIGGSGGTCCAVATYRSRGGGGTVNNRTIDVVGGDFVVAGVPSRTVLDNKIAARIDIDAARIVGDVVAFNAVVGRAGMNSGAVSGSNREAV